MSNTPLILSNNLYDATVQNPTSIVTTNIGPTFDVAGHELWRIYDNLRDATYWTNSQTNAAIEIILTNQTPAVGVAPTVFVLDRGHNLAGATIELFYSPTSASGPWTGLWTTTIPTSAGGVPGINPGCVTADGVFWLTFGSSSYPYWMLSIPALGAGIAPIITGLYMGVYYRMTEYALAPAAIDYRRKLQYQRNVQSRAGYRIKSRPLVYGELDIKTQLEAADYAGFDAQVSPLLYLNAPWWFCLDDSDATQSGLLRMFQLAGDFTYDPAANPVHRDINLQLEEVAPRVTL